MLGSVAGLDRDGEDMWTQGLFISMYDKIHYKKKKNIHNLKIESYVLFGGSYSGLGDSISSNTEITALRRWVEEPGYIEVFQQWVGSLNIKRLLLIKENRLSQVKEFSMFLCVGRRKSLGLLKSCIWFVLGCLGPVSCVFISWVSFP